MRTPAQFYQKSTIEYDGDEFELEYPANHLCRLISKKGWFKLHDQQIFITSALRGWHVGLEPISSQRYFLWFSKLCLGEIDLSEQSFKPLK